MIAATAFLVLLASGSMVLFQCLRALGRLRGIVAWLGLFGTLATLWFLLDLSAYPYPLEGNSSAPSASCFKCHESHYASWQRTYHRTMTREATPENVKGDFNDAVFTYQGIPSRMTREGDSFYMETLDPVWQNARSPPAPRPRSGGEGGPVLLPWNGGEGGLAPRLRKFKVERLVGSHWFQECLYRDGAGRYWRLPVSYHLVEKRWIHTNGAFLAPDTDDFWSKSTIWNESCVFCHNTKPSKRPVNPVPGRPGLNGYRTEVAELGIACEACHGPGAEHVRLNQNPLRRFRVRGEADPSIVNPRRLVGRRADDICAHCHAALAPRVQAWDMTKMTDPFNAGEDLTDAYHFFWSEAEQAKLYGNGPADRGRTPPPEPLDGRFWGDGTPLTTAVEYQGMALSACYENGQGRLSCLSCHDMHVAEPNFLLARGMDTNEACYQCHDSYRERLVEHTHHRAGSPGSLCYNCHMPYQVYSLLTTHRSHRISSPRIKDSLGTGKPHACNLCHLDRSLAWTQERLVEWYPVKPVRLEEEDRKYASALVHLCRSDARSRAVVAGSFSWPAARQAGDTAWAAPFLLRLLESERYPAVRYLVWRGLRSLARTDPEAYNYLGTPEERSQQQSRLRRTLAGPQAEPAGRYPYLPLTADGRIDEAAWNRLLEKRTDPDVFIHE
jgi:predicted CXXCH cytochrome family protein